MRELIYEAVLNPTDNLAVAVTGVSLPIIVGRGETITISRTYGEVVDHVVVDRIPAAKEKV